VCYLSYSNEKYLLCTGGISYALYISLLIYKLFCTLHTLCTAPLLMRVKIHYKGHWKGWTLKIETYLCPEIATYETHVLKIINVPVFNWRLGISLLMGANPFLAALWKRFALVVDLHVSKSLRPAPYKQRYIK
jgi:hypothetical protein